MEYGEIRLETRTDYETVLTKKKTKNLRNKRVESSGEKIPIIVLFQGQMN